MEAREDKKIGSVQKLKEDLTLQFQKEFEGRKQ